MKKILASLALTAVICSTTFAVSFTGTALVSSGGNLTGLAAGQVGIFINNDNNLNWNVFAGQQIMDGLSLFSSSTYTPIGTPSASFSFLGNRTVSGTTTLNLSGGISFDLGGGISNLDQFAVMVFTNSTSTTIAGDTYNIWRATDWIQQGNNGATMSFQQTISDPGSQYLQIRSGSPIVLSGQVVPEPSTYALMALGGLVLFYMVRRRKAQHQA